MSPRIATRIPPGRRGRLGGALALVLGFAALAAPARAAEVEVHHIHGLAIDRGDPKVVYVATHTGLARLGPGAAAEWLGTHRFDLMGFTAHPSEAGLVYASGHPDIPTYRRDGVGNLGLLLSQDGGRTWQSAALRGEVDFHALTFAPWDGGQLFGWNVAGQRGLYRVSTETWKAEPLAAVGLADVFSLAALPTADGTLLAGTRSGLRLSRDGGKSWAAARGLPSGVRVTAVAAHATIPGLVYAYVAGDGWGLMRSADGGGTWQRAGLAGTATAPVIAIALGPGREVAAATTAADVLASEDEGRSWVTLVDKGKPVRAR